MKFRNYGFRIAAVLPIILSLLLSVYVIINHNIGNAASQGTFVQNQHGPSFGQRQNHPRSMSNVKSPGNLPLQPMHAMPGGREATAGSNYNTQIIVYAITFFLVVLAAYFALIRKKAGRKFSISHGNQRMLLITLFFVGFLLRIVLGILIAGHPFDLNLFRSWATSAANNLSQFYSGRNSSDYPPLYIYVLYIVGKLGSLKALNPYFTLFLKLPSILADMGTALLLFKLSIKYLSPELSILVAALYIFNPAVFVNSTIWGQVDSFFTLIVIAGIVLLTEQKLVYSSILFTAAVLMKPQGIIFLPILFFELVRRKRLKDIVRVLITSAITAILLVLPFSTNDNILWIFKLFTNTIGEYPYATVNAFNFFYLLGANYTKDSLTLFLVSYHVLGIIFIVLTTLTAWLVFVRGKKRRFGPAAALILISGVFIFSTRMHERYLFPAVALTILAFIYLKDRRLLLLATGFSITSFVNTYDILYQTIAGIHQSTSSVIPVITSSLNVILFIYLIKISFGLSEINPHKLNDTLDTKKN
ncbi:hypothetical protein DEAC_c28200 [Desulfosporosinus acididurans]|uniref:Glycosyltransferase RgtA/B/C/D-like domain-containing protein n=1 Tax=Desulfosporosinus acididurans TaxID=476652 RepID=A0A0J1FQL4_9FIRM|nr:DUF2029 domain-containing protein [Desulfosporosinus acididurans]KLU65268.1 hypothetical protein DEAC_c28200 [Desulfosporosinus acididurans]